MKRAGRTLDHDTLEEFRLLALRRVKEGEKPSAVVKSLGMNRTSIYRWLRAASGRGNGERALASRPATGRPCKLTASQQAQVFRWINGKDPRQYGLDFGLWTRQIAAMLIEQKFGVRLGVTAVGRVLARLGLTPQKPPEQPQRDLRQMRPGLGLFSCAPLQSGRWRLRPRRSSAAAAILGWKDVDRNRRGRHPVQCAGVSAVRPLRPAAGPWRWG